MSRKLDSRTIFIVWVILFFLITIAFLLFKEKQHEPLDRPVGEGTNYTLDYVQLKKFINQLKTENPKSVYNQLIRDTANSPFRTRHDLAHIFGKALYQVKKASGISVCDSNLSFGCYRQDRVCIPGASME
ncbi:MAG: hypothetical protein US19_C0034G0005 [Candidatus Daviesbacteria bacterium GW2011_GWB1_36_5]|uniref:Uncharacterized protein n=1 Tax=Candidatus Daviesbacteria bacterium GW2011_GWB1_36_5 TaxID=1618426 RepID=A0A0G0H7A1_9BACT|nr:MAG: hypothetical protein US19_C0034G0005 [Candidatus Daviesbacteria bacterium GW2011_GWB1_36_5]